MNSSSPLTPEGSPSLFDFTDVKLPKPTKNTAKKKTPAVAEELPIARVLVNIDAPHLDRTFDYLVPAEISSQVLPGVRVAVFFSGKRYSGFIIERIAATDFSGKLSWIKQLQSGEPVVTIEQFELTKEVAKYYAGSWNSVLQAAVPKRHLAAEKAPFNAANVEAPGSSLALNNEDSVFEQYEGGIDFLNKLKSESTARACWQVLTDHNGVTDWIKGFLEASFSVIAAGKQVLLLVPSVREAKLIEESLSAAIQIDSLVWPSLKEFSFTSLHSGLSPADRYRNYLAILNGKVQLVIGTRNAAFAPLSNLGLIALYDDLNQAHQEEQLPYWHAREVVAIRSRLTDCSLLVASVTESLNCHRWIITNWADRISTKRGEERNRVPRMIVLDDDSSTPEDLNFKARIPELTWRAISKALEIGPVLIQVPRKGYLPFVVCNAGKHRAKCKFCAGPLSVPERGSYPQCRWCGQLQGGWRCEICGDNRLRASQIGSERTVEELGRAFPKTRVISSSSSSAHGVLSEIPAKPALVIATVGGEPFVNGGYQMLAILDADLSASRMDLYADQTLLYQWLRAASLVKSRADGGQVHLIGNAEENVRHSFRHWDPSHFVSVAFQERVGLQLPPVTRLALIVGERSRVKKFLERTKLPASVKVLGISPLSDAEELRYQKDGIANSRVFSKVNTNRALLGSVKAVLQLPLKDSLLAVAAIASTVKELSGKGELRGISVILDPKEL